MFKTAEDIRQLNERITHAGQFTDKLKEEIGQVIVGQILCLTVCSSAC
jgi:MoxR-like ATPase